MNRKTFEELKSRLELYKYTSLKYEEYEDMEDFELLRDDPQLILVYGWNKAAGMNQLHFAADAPDGLLAAIHNKGHNILVSFVPAEWKDEFDRQGFIEYGILREYWINFLRPDNGSIPAYTTLQKDEYEEASRVTLSVKLQSREFQGESPEWIGKWMSGNEPNAAACSCRDCNILAHKDGNVLAGIVCVAVYEHESKKGPIVWIREIAVRPEYQNQGIGRLLLMQGLKYGAEHGAVRAFLMADECNYNAISLYKSVGFVPDMSDVQIDMIYI